MKTAFWLPYISDGTINAICWTLIHSLWIGVVAALLAGSVLSFARRSASKLRYTLLCCILVLFVSSVTFIFFVQLKANKVSVNTGAPVKIINLQGTTAVNHSEHIVTTDIFSKALTFLNQNTVLIFLVWLMFFVIKSLKMVSGLLYIQRIRNYKIQQLSEEIKGRITNFSRELGIKQKVLLVQSELVKIPVAVGWLRPMIILPVGIVCQLTPAQLDGILWHELAHISRRDYLVNMLQGITEAIFFFNPGLLWLSSLIRAEREACCDDIVLSRTNSKTNYLQALLTFSQGEFKHANLALSVGSGNQLRDRLKRMISQENKRLNRAEKSILAIGIIVLSAFTAISKEIPAIKHLTVKIKGKQMAKAVNLSTQPLLQRSKLSSVKLPAAENYTIMVTDTAVRFTSVLFKTSDADLGNSEVSAMDDKRNKYHFITVDGKIVSMEVNRVKVAENRLTIYDFVLRNIGRELATKRRARETNFAEAKIAYLKAQSNFDNKKATM